MKIKIKGNEELFTEYTKLLNRLYSLGHTHSNAIVQNDYTLDKKQYDEWIKITDKERKELYEACKQVIIDYDAWRAKVILYINKK